ncbi:LPS translocon maturation chaperone LptM [Sansalvadorimonas verongulae]|nr:lipoprotein [Sansalvadorimonas verongulae]MTI14422.1 hypothetical protein [Sansalvadorimonas verongulae]
MKRALALVSLSLLLTACGQKGPLIIPDAQPAALTVQHGGAGS